MLRKYFAIIFAPGPEHSAVKTKKVTESTMRIVAPIQLDECIALYASVDIEARNRA